MESEDYISHIRSKTKCNVTDQRTLKRSALFNSRRSNIEVIENQMKTLSLPEFKELCQIYVQHKRLHDLQKIRFGLCLDEQFISAFLTTDRALYSLVGSLTGGTAKLQMESLFCFINLGMGTQQQCLKICEKAGAYLISLGSNNVVLQEFCLWVFANLCGSHPKVCKMARGQGLESELEKGLSSTNENVVISAAYALNQYLNTAPYRINEFITSEIIKLLVESLKSNKDALKDLCWCMFIISTQKSKCSILTNFGVVLLSLQVLQESVKDLKFDVCIITSLVRLLSNIVAVVNNTSIEICYHADIFTTVCSQLLRCQYSHLQQETTQLIVNVVNAAQSVPTTGSNILEDSHLQERLEPALRAHFASQFSLKEPQFCFS